jgi:16S rRNA (cytidine1402-2'-O)-methyltransferase
MEKRKVRKDGTFGTLYVVSTPIGNMEDITLRALKVLKGAALIAAENVAHTKRLCGHYGIKTRLTSVHQHNQKIRAPRLIKRLESGHDVAMVTNAGTPGISDPGIYLINQAAKRDIKVTPIPGASAVIAALSVAGLPAEGFVFLGFLPNKPGKRKKTLAELVAEPRTMVFFEAPHRIIAMLTDLRKILGDRHMVMLREMTKVYEELNRGPVSAILAHLKSDRIRGEFTLVVAGTGGDEEEAQALSEEVLCRIEQLLVEKKMGIKDIANLLSKEEGLAYRQIYRECLARKKELGGFEGHEVGQKI